MLNRILGVVASMGIGLRAMAAAFQPPPARSRYDRKSFRGRRAHEREGLRDMMIRLQAEGAARRARA